MVTLLPCADCIVSLVDKPPFVVSLADVEHVHLERVTFTNKDFDLVFIFKEGVRDKGEDEIVRIASIPMRGHLDSIKTWLDEIADMTFTEGVNNFNWKSIIEDVVRQPDFWADHDAETGEEKPEGWDFLRDEEKGSGERAGRTRARARALPPPTRRRRRAATAATTTSATRAPSRTLSLVRARRADEDEDEDEEEEAYEESEESEEEDDDDDFTADSEESDDEPESGSDASAASWSKLEADAEEEDTKKKKVRPRALALA